MAVLGAGIAGLTAAHFLAATDGIDVEVFEAKEVAGGRANVVNGAEHCQRLFLSDYREMLPLLGQIPFDETASVLDRLVPIRRFACPPTLGWVEISHQYSLFAPEIGLAEKLRILREGRRSVLLARKLRGDANFLGGPKNRYSIGSKLAVARTFVRRQRSFSLPGPTDSHFIQPWVRYLRSRGVSIQLSSEVESVAPGPNGVEICVRGGPHRFDAVISTLFAPCLRALLDRSRIGHRLPHQEHAHCPCFTLAFDPAERSPKTAIPALYSHQGIGLVVQPEARRCLVLCIRSPRSDRNWVLSEVAEILELSRPVASVGMRPNEAADEALFIGDHIRRDRVLASPPSPRFQVAGSWTRNGYPVDSGESAVRSALSSVRAVCVSLGLPPPVTPGGRAA